RDGWERYFTYQISRQICDFDPTAAIIGQVGAPTNCTPDDYQNGTGLAGAGTEWLTMRTTDPAIGSCNPPIITNCPATLSTNIAYVLVSHGPDGDRAYTTNGGLRQVAASLGAMEERQEINAHENANDTQFWTDRFS